jgi:hypothetical protein
LKSYCQPPLNNNGEEEMTFKAMGPGCLFREDPA